jgi:D-alanyl-D-alanine carboxypeptidase|tara:strand:- start:6639 stop:7781 length:1143 start_codon:yes stop_codon:yes gene_type:complete
MLQEGPGKMGVMKVVRAVVFIMAGLVAVSAPAQQNESLAISAVQLQLRLDEVQQTNQGVPGFAIAVIKDGAPISAATGIAAPDNTPMTAQTPFRLASVTKTFVAASILRLHEQGRISLDAAISELLSQEHLRLLQTDGYDVEAITVRHLLMHSAGLNDHFGTEEMRRMVFANPAHVWTPTEQIRLMVEASERLGAPGDRFAYSDTGYVLLGEIVERISGKPLGQAVRDLNRFDTLQLDDLRWEGEAPGKDAPDRAHQWISGFDTYALDGSVDAFGGGGLIGDVRVTARYFDALFGGSVFSNPETLEEMKTAPSHPDGSPYRLGLFTNSVGGQEAFMHGGFWGVFAIHVPAKNLTIVGVALDQSGEPAIRELALDLIDPNR